MKAHSVLVVAISLLSLLGQTSLAACGDHTDCSSCVSEGGCMWALIYNCTERCIGQKRYKGPNEIKEAGAIWRSVVRDKAQCPNREMCKIMEGDVPNPSFEKWSWHKYSKKEKAINEGREGTTEHFPWVFARSISVKNHTIAKKTYENELYNSVDGEFFLIMGGNGRTKVFELRLDGMLRISKDATHLSFFYALPYYSKYFGNFYPFINRTALDVYIDNEHLLHMHDQSIDKTFYQNSDAFYHPMNINISRFADGKNHSLNIYFTEASNYVKEGDERTPGQIMFVDYIQVINSNCKLQKYICQQVISLFTHFQVNGSTFDGWAGAPFDRETSCQRYCLDKYISDGVCDMVCMTEECKNDGGDCVCKYIYTNMNTH